MQTPGDFWGALKQDAHNRDDSQVVTKELLLDGYDVFGEAHGDEIEVVNPMGGGNHAERFWSGRQTPTPSKHREVTPPEHIADHHLRNHGKCVIRICVEP